MTSQRKRRRGKTRTNIEAVGYCCSTWHRREKEEEAGVDFCFFPSFLVLILTSNQLQTTVDTELLYMSAYPYPIVPMNIFVFFSRFFNTPDENHRCINIFAAFLSSFLMLNHPCFLCPTVLFLITFSLHLASTVKKSN